MNINTLMALARDRSANARTRLVENITDMFVANEGRLTAHERALMTDILSKLVLQVEVEVRARLAECLVKTQTDIPDIVEMLANDEIAIAEPLLRNSKLLRDESLIEIVRMRTDEHRMAIALREQVSSHVSDALIEYGSQDVVEALLSNDNAALSSQAMEYMVTEARRVDQFQEPLLRRSDLPPELAYRMYWWVSAALRKYIVSHYSIDPLVLEQALHEGVARTRRQFDAQEDNAYRKAQKLAYQMREAGQLTVGWAITALRQQRILVCVAAFAELADIEFMVAWRIFNDAGGQSLAILAAAVGMERSQFASLFLQLYQLSAGHTPVPPSVLSGALSVFDNLNLKRARAALLVWQRDAAFQEALDMLDGNAAPMNQYKAQSQRLHRGDE